LLNLIDLKGKTPLCDDLPGMIFCAFAKGACGVGGQWTQVDHERLLERRLEILFPIKYALDEHGVFRDGEGDGRAALEADRAQAGQEIIALATAFREGRKRQTIVREPFRKGVGNLVLR
jgi:hypothetical protein